MKSPSAHYLNVDESDQTSENSSLMSLNNDQRALLSSGSTADQIGKLSFHYFSTFLSAFILWLYDFSKQAIFDVEPKPCLNILFKAFT